MAIYGRSDVLACHVVSSQNPEDGHDSLEESLVELVDVKLIEWITRHSHSTIEGLWFCLLPRILLDTRDASHAHSFCVEPATNCHQQDDDWVAFWAAYLPAF